MDHIGEKIISFIKKYRYAALILLLGIILMLLPGKEEHVEEQPDRTETQSISSPDMETRLSAILSQIHGAGRVEVMLTEAEGERTVYQSDIDSTNDDSGSTNRSTTVIVTDETRKEAGLVQQIDPPAYLGAIIVCQGAESPVVRLAIVEAVSNVTGLRADRISVLKMK